MTYNISTAANRTIISTLAALAMSAALPQAGFANGSMDDGVWKLNPSKSSVNVGDASKSNALTIERKATPEASGDPSRLLIIANGNVYVATGEAAKDALAGKRVDPKRMVQIGSNVRSNDLCGDRCQLGLPERHKTLTFTTLSGQQKVLAYGGH